MRIALFSHSSQPGGAQNVLALLYKGLVTKGHEVETVPRHSWPDLEPDVVISNTITHDDGLYYAEARLTPHVWYVHEFLQDGAEIPEDNIVAVSEAVRKQSGGKVIYTGIPVAECRQSPDPVVLTVGGICRRKGQMTLLRAAVLVPKARFVSVGGPWERDYFIEISRERERLGVGKDRFVMHGMKRDMEPYYRKGRIFASAPEREPFGLAILEAMAHGLPVVTTRSGGPEEIVVDGRTGFLVDVGDYEAMAERIRYLLERPGEVVRMGLAGYERVKTHFTYERFIDEWDQYIREVAA